MSRSGDPGLSPGPDPDTRPVRPASVDVVASILVFGGLFGVSQLLFGDFVITGSLPAKDPILGVAAVLYVASITLGVAIRTGRAWLPTLNLAGLFAILYLAALGHALTLLLGVAHVVAAVLLFRARPWFAGMARWRHPPAALASKGGRPERQSAAKRSGRGPNRRPSGRR